MQIQSLTYFFWWCSGAEINILKNFPTEYNKYFCIGGTIFGTWILASVSGWYAFYTISSSNIFSIFLGIIWGLIIFNLDRYITSSMKKTCYELEDYLVSEKIYHFILELLPSVPRILIAIIIGFTISKPIELKLFESEIAEKITIIQENKTIEIRKLTEFYDKEIFKISDEINVLKKEIDKISQDNRREIYLYDEQANSINNEINELRKRLSLEGEKVIKFYNDLNNEITGTGGSLRKGRGPIAKMIEQNFMEAKERYDKIEKEIENEKARIKDIQNRRDNEEKRIQDKTTEAELNISNKILKRESEIEKLKSQKDTDLLKFNKKLSNGLLVKIEAFSDLVRQHNSIRWTNILIILLIYLIETAPIFVKLISDWGPYDAMVEHINKSITYELNNRFNGLKKNL